jgi:SAM-dependent methyltransferase
MVSVKTNLAADEKRKYKEIWGYSQYRHHSPGEWCLPIFKQLVRKYEGTLIDLGCGTGRAGDQLSELGFQVTLLDFADNCLDYQIKKKEHPFIVSNLWGNWKGRWDYGYCCDVMEHMPPEKVDSVLKKISKNCGKCFFNIHFSDDNFGKLVGHPLHLTVKPFLWWLDKLREFGEVKNARDLIGMGSFFVEFK